MKYFTKYIIAKEQPKNGDKIMHPTIKGVIIEYNKLVNQSFYDLGWRKVNLYLCSKDIKVGDKVYPNYLVYEDGSEGRPEGYWMHLSAVTLYDFKVFAQVSPAATWVKEDQRFDEKDFKLVYKRFVPSNEGRSIIPIDQYTRLLEIKPEKAKEYSLMAQMKCKGCDTFK